MDVYELGEIASVLNMPSTMQTLPKGHKSRHRYSIRHARMPHDFENKTLQNKDKEAPLL